MTSTVERLSGAADELTPIEFETMLLAQAHALIAQEGLRPATLELYVTRALNDGTDEDWPIALVRGGVRQQLGLALAQLVRRGFLDVSHGYVVTAEGARAVQATAQSSGIDQKQQLKDAEQLVTSAL